MTPVQQLKVLLPPELRTALDAAAAKSGKSLAEEIRQRLERTFAEDGLDESTRGLVAAVKWLSADISTRARWNKSSKAREALSLAIATVMNAAAMTDDKAAKTFDPLADEDVATLARAMARHFLTYVNRPEGGKSHDEPKGAW
jgi:hypothetical protein